MDKVNVFTSTGAKLIHHPESIERLQIHKMGSPISLQIAPTSRCNLSCDFCSNINRDLHEDLPLIPLLKFIDTLSTMGLKVIEISGGGDPTLYHGINELIDHCHIIGLKIGLISNGTLLKKKITQKNLDKLHWLRISMNCLDYLDSVDIPIIKGTLGFSYVMNNRTDPRILERLQSYVNFVNPEYVRIVPNCQATHEEQKENNRSLSSMVEQWGHPYFYQTKEFQKPDNCYWGYFKPFLLHDGFVYPCSSVVLNDTANRKFHDMFRWSTMEEYPTKLLSVIQPFSTENCTHCVFTSQNNLVHSILNTNGMEDFI